MPCCPAASWPAAAATRRALPQWRARGPRRRRCCSTSTPWTPAPRRPDRRGVGAARVGAGDQAAAVVAATGTSSRSRRSAPRPGPSSGWRSSRCAAIDAAGAGGVDVAVHHLDSLDRADRSGRPAAHRAAGRRRRRGARARGGGRRPRRAGHHRGRRVAPARAAGCSSHVRSPGSGEPPRWRPGFFVGRRQPGDDRGAGAQGGPDQGSGNPGATNTGRLLGLRWGVVVGVFDVLKGLVPTLVALRWLGRPDGLRGRAGLHPRARPLAVPARPRRQGGGDLAGGDPGRLPPRSRWGWWCCSG